MELERGHRGRHRREPVWRHERHAHPHMHAHEVLCVRGMVHWTSVHHRDWRVRVKRRRGHYAVHWMMYALTEPLSVHALDQYASKVQGNR